MPVQHHGRLQPQSRLLVYSTATSMRHFCVLHPAPNLPLVRRSRELARARHGHVPTVPAWDSQIASHTAPHAVMVPRMDCQQEASWSILLVQLHCHRRGATVCALSERHGDDAVSLSSLCPSSHQFLCPGVTPAATPHARFVCTMMKVRPPNAPAAAPPATHCAQPATPTVQALSSRAATLVRVHGFYIPYACIYHAPLCNSSSHAPAPPPPPPQHSSVGHRIVSQGRTTCRTCMCIRARLSCPASCHLVLLWNPHTSTHSAHVRGTIA